MPSAPEQGPYKGLAPFTEKDAKFFFGRENDRQTIIANLYAARLTILFGPSGVGKSSVLQAGVAWALHQRPGQAVIVFADWQEKPLVPFKYAIVQEIRRVAPASGELNYNLPLDQLLTASARYLRQPMMILLDQFEDYLLFHPVDKGQGSFEVEFARAVNQEGLPVSFLIGIREDYLAKLDRFERRIPNLFDNYLRLEHLDLEEARQAITEPLEVYNQDLPQDRHVAIEATLVQEILRQVRIRQQFPGSLGLGKLPPHELKEQSERGEARVEATYLQLVMKRLWDEEVKQDSYILRLATFSRLGGAEKIVKSHLDDVMRMLKPAQQDVAAQIFQYLVTTSGVKIALSAEDLATFTQLSAETIEAVAQALASRDIRILRQVTDPVLAPDQIRYQIFHDTLIPAILDWRNRYNKASPFRDLQRTILPALILVVASVLLAPFLGRLPLALALLRAIAFIVLNIVLLLQVFRWFYKFANLSVRPLPLFGPNAQNLGRVLGTLLSLLWYAATVWPPEFQANPLGTIGNDRYAGYLLTVMPTLLIGVLAFYLMRGVGALTDRVFRNFDLGFYGVYISVCLAAGVLILYSLLTNQPLEWFWIP